MFISALYCRILDSASSWCLRLFFTIFASIQLVYLGFSSLSASSLFMLGDGSNVSPIIGHYNADAVANIVAVSCGGYSTSKKIDLRAIAENWQIREIKIQGV